MRHETLRGGVEIVKIGVADDPRKRMETLQGRYEPLLALRGSRNHEKQVHRYFSEYKLTRAECEALGVPRATELFYCAPPIRGWLERIRRRGCGAWAPWTEETLRLAFASEECWPWVGESGAEQEFLFPEAAKLVHRSRVTHYDDYYTPMEWVARVRDVFGGVIELDPASSYDANKLVGAEKIFTINDNALTREWRARTVFLNPPYGEQGRFVAKLLREYAAGRAKEAIALLSNKATSALYFPPLWRAGVVCFVRGRIRFVGPDDTGDNPNAGHLFVYLGPKPRRFVECFDGPDIGTVMCRWHDRGRWDIGGEVA